MTWSASGKLLILSFSLQTSELQMTIDGLEKERDFYFGKLRDIEIMCQENEENPTIKKIVEILYATEVSLSRYHSLLSYIMAWNTNDITLHKIKLLVEHSLFPMAPILFSKVYKIHLYEITSLKVSFCYNNPSIFAYCRAAQVFLPSGKTWSIWTHWGSELQGVISIVLYYF